MKREELIKSYADRLAIESCTLFQETLTEFADELISLENTELKEKLEKVNEIANRPMDGDSYAAIAALSDNMADINELTSPYKKGESHE